ncbi:MAG TPA: ATP-binding protein [Kofleriaceae bacterium]|nr:ATP-binding protein [Kofleriaceae bacterium]
MAAASLVQVDSKRRHAVGEHVTIGRAAESDVQLDDPMVASRHAEVVHQPDGSYVVRDLGSRRGTFVGSRKVSESPLVDGDELLIGPVRLQFELEAAKPATSDAEELRKLRAIVELTRAIGVEHDLDKLLVRVLETCFQLLRADRATIAVYVPGSKTPATTVARTRTGDPIENALSTSVLSEMMATRAPSLRTQVDDGVALQRSESLCARGVRSLIAVPLYMDTEWLGVIQLDSNAMDNVFAQRDLELLGAIASQASLAIHNAMLVQQMQARRSDDWRRLERVVASLPVGVVVLDDQNRCVLANEWIVQRASTIGEVRESVISQIAGIPAERLTSGNVRVQTTVGSPEVTFVVDARTTADGAETVIVLNDVTAERAQQAKAAHQERLASIGQLAGGVAHDFNNLLFVILNFATAIEETYPETAEEIGVITQSARSAADLVKQLLAFSRREVVKPKVIDIAAAIRGMDKLVARTVGADVALDIEVPAEPQRVLIDPTQLEQIIMNLAVNARDAMQGRGRLSIRVIADAKSVAIDVADTGSGMPSEVVARIFEPYFTTKEIGKGTGLGLATVHGIVEHAGGKIAVASEPDCGTTFHIALPKTTLASEAMTGEIRATRGTVLLVDDDDAVRRLTERMLRAGGYQVIAAASAPDALALARTSRFDILLTDLVMPGMSGRELAREIGTVYADVRIVFMSGYNPGMPIPASQFLAKPFDRNSLLTALGTQVAAQM